MTTRFCYQPRFSPTVPRAVSMWLRALVLWLIMLQIVAPIWHVCAMSGHDMSGHTSHAQCATPATNVREIEYSNSESAPAESSNHETSHHHDEDEGEENHSHAESHSHESSHQHESSHVHADSHEDSAHETEKCAAGKDDLCCIEDRNNRLISATGGVTQTPMSHGEMNCLAMLLTTMPGRASAFLLLSPALQSRTIPTTPIVVSRGVTRFALCDARAPPVFSA